MEALLTTFQNLQNRAARVVTHSEFDTPVDQLFQRLGWKTVRQLITNDTAVMVYKSMYDFAPSYLNDLFKHTSDVHKVNVRGADINLCPPRAGTKMGQHY